MKEIALAGDSIPKTAPLPMLSGVDEPSACWIGFDIPNNVEQMPITLDVFAPVSALKDVTLPTSSIQKPEIAGVSMLNPVHVRRYFLQVVHAYDQVKVIRHQAVRIEAHTVLFSGLSQQDEKRRVIKGFAKDDLLVVTAIDDVEDGTR